MQRKPFWAQKTWWMAVLSALVPVLNQTFGWGLDPAQLLAVILPIAIFIAGEKWADGKHAGRGGQQ